MQKKKGDDIQEYPECFGHSKRILEGLCSVNVVLSSSLVQQAPKSIEVAVGLFRR